MARRRNLIASFIVFRLSEIKKAAITRGYLDRIDINTVIGVVVTRILRGFDLGGFDVSRPQKISYVEREKQPGLHTHGVPIPIYRHKTREYG